MRPFSAFLAVQGLRAQRRRTYHAREEHRDRDARQHEQVEAPRLGPGGAHHAAPRESDATERTTTRNHPSAQTRSTDTTSEAS